jgi:hypothetical protein
MGRPYKCPCGSSNNTSKGVRKTKTMGVRRIRLCKDCGKKFTPRNQKVAEGEEQPASTTPAAPAVSTAVETTDATAASPTEPTSPTVPTETNTAPNPAEEVIDHPRY